MFGYVKPNPAELYVREYEFYKSVYCGVCRSMKRTCGRLTALSLSYDFVFLALVRLLYAPGGTQCRHRCIAHPLKKRCMLTDSAVLDLVGREAVLLTWHKIRDDLADRDCGFFRRCALRLVSPVYRRGVRRGGLNSLSAVCEEKLAALSELERAREASVDAPAQLFGELLGAVFACGLEGADARVAGQVGFHLGKFIYAADAAEDFAADAESGSYNPYVLLYGGRALSGSARAAVRCGLLLELEQMEKAVQLLPFGEQKGIRHIIENILYDGLLRRISFLEEDGGATGKETTAV